MTRISRNNVPLASAVVKQKWKGGVARGEFGEIATEVLEFREGPSA